MQYWPQTVSHFICSQTKWLTCTTTHAVYRPFKILLFSTSYATCILIWHKKFIIWICSGKTSRLPTICCPHVGGQHFTVRIYMYLHSSVPHLVNHVARVSPEEQKANSVWDHMLANCMLWSCCFFPTNLLLLLWDFLLRHYFFLHCNLHLYYIFSSTKMSVINQNNAPSLSAHTICFTMLFSSLIAFVWSYLSCPAMFLYCYVNICEMIGLKKNCISTKEQAGT